VRIDQDEGAEALPAPRTEDGTGRPSLAALARELEDACARRTRGRCTSQ
jgi:hypothetical protein